MELGKFENSRTFHAPKGNQKVIRDTNPVQVTRVTTEEPQVEIKMSGEPSLEKVVKEIPKPKKRRRTKKINNEKP